MTCATALTTDVFGLRMPVPFGLSVNILLFILATPAVLWGGQMFFAGAYRALKTVSWICHVGTGRALRRRGLRLNVAETFFFASEVFYEASVVLLAFVLFGH